MRTKVLVVTASLLGACARPMPAPVEARHDAGAHAPARTALPPIDAEQPRDYPGVHNVVAYADGLYSGSVPEGAEGFETLEAMGFRTIISVDGARPNVEEAAARGLRYVHLPIGYNGMDRERTLEIARAVSELPGPIYLHCHHGRHRSAGAAGAAAVTLGLTTPDEATSRMKVSGTSPSYTGLYRCVAIASIAAVEDLEGASSAFPSVWKTSGLVRTMVEVEEVFAHLEAIEKAGWVAPRDHPDLVPVAEAGRLADLLRNLEDDERVRSKPAELTRWMLEGSALCEALEEGLARPVIDPVELSARFALVSTSCNDCHVKYRDR